MNTGLPEAHRHTQAVCQATGGNGCKILEDCLKRSKCSLPKTIKTLPEGGKARGWPYSIGDELKSDDIQVGRKLSGSLTLINTFNSDSRQQECIKWVLAASRDKRHCTCIHQSCPSPTAHMIHKITCSLTESSLTLWKGHSPRRWEPQEISSNITEHPLFARHYAKDVTSSIYSILPAPSVIGRHVLELACTSLCLHLFQVHVQ